MLEVPMSRALSRVPRGFSWTAVALLLALPARAVTPDPAVEKKIDALLARMTLEEKVGQLQQLNNASPSEARRLVEAGRLGSMLTLTDPKEIAALRDLARGSRLGIPLIFGYDVIHGFRTVFPVPLAEASSWNPALAERSAEVAAREAAAVGIDWTFAPMVDVARDPRWGRIVEGSGEDPFLGATFAAARVRGFRKGGVAACPKHYVAYGAAEAGRDYNGVEVSEATLRDVYLPPFKAAVDAGAETLMSSFNTINGVPATANHHTLTEILRGEWGFDGFVVSDWASVWELINHGVAKDKADAARIALDAGVDMEMVTTCYQENLANLVRDGAVPVKTVDEAVRRILRIKYRLGLFEKSDPDPAAAAKVLLAEEHRRAAREVARESMVLLKNEGPLLPVSAGVRSIAVVGPLADAGSEQIGAWSGDGRGADSLTVLAGIRARAGSSVDVTYAKGCEIDATSPDGFAEAVAAAREADAVVAVLGESASMSGEAGSRAFLTLPGIQQQLLETLVATGKPVALVLMAGRPLDLRWAAAKVPAILVAWHPGTEGGAAVADLLFGDASPSGKLTVSFPRSLGQVPVYYSQRPTGRPASAARFTSRYIDESNEPLFPFGFGLSYTTFAYSGLALSAKSVPLGGTLQASVRVKNTGPRAGQEVVQLYVHDLVASRSRPLRELKGFEKVSLAAGEEKTVIFALNAKDLGFHDDKGRYLVEPGAFKLWVGGSSKADLEADFQVE
jgi:beta-glucosidase